MRITEVVKITNVFRICGLMAVRRRKRASEYGAQMPEFAAALVVLLVVIALPLLDFGMVPISWLLSQEIVTNYTHRLALCQSFGQAITMVDADDSVLNQLSKLGGAQFQGMQCSLIITQIQAPFASIVIKSPGTIPSVWLPGGTNSPCSYEIKLSVQVSFSPLVVMNFPDANIPGLTEPINGVIEAKSAWENYGSDPATGQFFINE